MSVIDKPASYNVAGVFKLEDGDELGNEGLGGFVARD